MSDAAILPLVFSYREAHARLIKVVDQLSDEQFQYRATPTSHSIAFNLWHVARWSDGLQARLPAFNADLAERLGERRQIWEQEELATKWGFDPAALGYLETGMRMEEEVAAAIPFPAKAVVLDYARRAFARADEAIGALDEQLLAGPNEPELRQRSITNLGGRFTVADAILSHLSHNNRHLGEIECLRGLLGLFGSATQ